MRPLGSQARAILDRAPQLVTAEAFTGHRLGIAAKSARAWHPASDSPIWVAIDEAEALLADPELPHTYEDVERLTRALEAFRPASAKVVSQSEALPPRTGS